MTASTKSLRDFSLLFFHTFHYWLETKYQSYCSSIDSTLVPPLVSTDTSLVKVKITITQWIFKQFSSGFVWHFFLISFGVFSFSVLYTTLTGSWVPLCQNHIKFPGNASVCNGHCIQLLDSQHVIG